MVYMQVVCLICSGDFRWSRLQSVPCFEPREASIVEGNRLERKDHLAGDEGTFQVRLPASDLALLSRVLGFRGSWS